MDLEHRVGLTTHENTMLMCDSQCSSSSRRHGADKPKIIVRREPDTVPQHREVGGPA